MRLQNHGSVFYVFLVAFALFGALVTLEIVWMITEIIETGITTFLSNVWRILNVTGLVLVIIWIIFVIKYFVDVSGLEIPTTESNIYNDMVSAPSLCPITCLRDTVWSDQHAKHLRRNASRDLC